MKNRFSSAYSRRSSVLSQVILPLAMFAVVLILFLGGVSSISNTADAEQLRAAYNAVVRSTVQCYALEGQYPPNVQYLRDNYGLSVDEGKYIIHYDIFASNVMPQIAVLPKNSSPGVTL